MTGEKYISPSVWKNFGAKTLKLQNFNFPFPAFFLKNMYFARANSPFL